MKKVVIFDLDGLLVDTEYLFFQAIKTVLRERNIRVHEKDYIKSDVQTGSSLLHELKEKNHDLDIKGAQRHIYKVYSRLLGEQKIGSMLMPGVLKTVKKLKKHFTLAIASSSKRTYAGRILKRAGISRDFAQIVCREDVSNLKPSPECLNLIAERLDTRPDRCVVIEDSARGLRAAKAAGMSCIVVPNKFTNDYHFKEVDRAVKSLEDINAKLINKILNRKLNEVRRKV